MNPLIEAEPNYLFWPRVLNVLELTGKISDVDADQIFERSDIDLKILERQLYVMAKVRKKKVDRYWANQDRAEIDFIKKFGGSTA